MSARARTCLANSRERLPVGNFGRVGRARASCEVPRQQACTALARALRTPSIARVGASSVSSLDAPARVSGSQDARGCGATAEIENRETRQQQQLLKFARRVEICSSSSISSKDAS